MDWQAADRLRFRAGYNRAVRAPNVGELFLAQNVGERHWEGIDMARAYTMDGLGGT